ncbi:hypothetical protein O3M35_002566 [Rhynocoris fuscipes]|uniref:Odorant receptor n=1 Tax=Rhynocoris fuscipes TaxID=488301 RepID=A0AAW1CTG1_9HEMI
MRASLAVKLCLRVEPDETEIWGFGENAKSKTLGRAKVNVKIDEVRISDVPIVIVSDCCQPYDFVVGRTWIDSTRVSYVKGKEEIEFITPSEIPSLEIDYEPPRTRIVNCEERRTTSQPIIPMSEREQLEDTAKEINRESTQCVENDQSTEREAESNEHDENEFKEVLEKGPTEELGDTIVEHTALEKRLEQRRLLTISGESNEVKENVNRDSQPILVITEKLTKSKINRVRREDRDVTQQDVDEREENEEVEERMSHDLRPFDLAVPITAIPNEKTAFTIPDGSGQSKRTENNFMNESNKFTFKPARDVSDSIERSKRECGTVRRVESSLKSERCVCGRQERARERISRKHEKWKEKNSLLAGRREGVIEGKERCGDAGESDEESIEGQTEGANVAEKQDQQVRRREPVEERRLEILRLRMVKDEKNKHFVNYAEKIGRKISSFIFLVCNSFPVIAFFYVTLTDFAFNRKEKHLVHRVWTPWDYQEIYANILTNILITILSLPCLSVYAGLHLWEISFTLYISAYAKTIENNLINNGIRNKKIYEQHKFMIEIVKDHNKILAAIKYWEAQISPLMPCGFAYSFLKALKRNEISIAMDYYVRASLTLIPSFITCCCGQQIISQMENLHHGTYMCNWYEESARRRKNFLTMMIRTTKTPTINYKLFVTFDHVLLGLILQTVYSYIMLMVNIDTE